MNSVSKIILFVVVYFSGLYAQNALDEQYGLADSLYRSEKYFDSITELKRLLFFDKEKQYTYKASSLIADCYRQGGKYTDALIWLTKAEMSTADKKELSDIKLQKVKIDIIRRNTRQALKEIDQLYLSEGDSSQANYWKGWVYMFNDDWDKASEYFAHSENGNELRLYSAETSSKLYNKTFAKVISYVIPGSGQIYTGHYFSGILSLGWNVLWGYTAVKAFQAERLFDGFAVASLLWARFYNGNLTNAEKFAAEENRRISDEALDYLQQNYKGKKP